jgi:hypothetical protein
MALDFTQPKPGSSPATPPVPVQPKLASVLPGLERMPLPAGTVLTADKQSGNVLSQVTIPLVKTSGQRINPTPTELAGMRALGIDPDSAIPTELAAALSQVLDDLEQVQTMTPVAPDTPPLQVDIADISRLDVQTQQRLRQAAQETLKAASQLGKAQQGQALEPSIAAALAAANDPGAPLLIADDTAATDKTGGTPAAAAPPPPPPGDRTGATVTRSGRCQRCNWDLERPEIVAITDADKLNFLQATLGAPKARFRRVYSLFGGHVQVQFRSLLPAEAALCTTQTAVDLRANSIVGDGEYIQRLLEYRMCAALEAIQFGETRREVIQPVEQIPWQVDSKHPFETVLSVLRPHVFNELIASEALRQAVAGIYLQFSDLTEKLAVNAQNEDFWKGIGEQA